MIKRGKKAQGPFGLSFGVIFSIILMVAIISVSFYAIKYFLGLNKCANTGLFQKDLQDEIDRAWMSGQYIQTYGGTLPVGIENVCFGKLTTDPSNDYSTDLHEYFTEEEDPPEGTNLFIYPPEKACGLEYNKLKNAHVTKTDISGIRPDFFCRNVSSTGKMDDIVIKFTDTEDNLVRIEKI